MNEKIGNVAVNLGQANGDQYLILADGKVLLPFSMLQTQIGVDGYEALEAWATKTFAAADAALAEFREMRGEAAKTAPE